MLRKLGLLVLFCLLAHGHAYAGERNLLFVIGRDVENGEYDIYSANPDNLEYRKIIDNGINPLWSPDGERIAYISHWNIPGKPYIYKLSLHVAKKDGSQIKNIRLKTLTGNPLHFAWSPDGQRIAVMAGSSILITTLDEEIASHEGSGEIYELAWLGDGRRIAFRDRDGISLLDTERGETTLVTSEGYVPKAFPGTDTLLYIARAGKTEQKKNLVLRELDKGVEEVIARNILIIFKTPYKISGDGKKVIFYKGEPTNSETELELGVYDFSTRSTKYYKTSEGIMEVISHNGEKIAGLFIVEGKGGYGICDLETGKKSLIREIQENELHNRMVMGTRLMDW